MTEFEVGYLMGLVVGEGSFTGDRKAGWLSIKLHMNDPAPLLEALNVCSVVESMALTITMADTSFTTGFRDAS